MSVLLLGFEPDTLSDEQVTKVRAAAPDMRVLVSRDKDEIEGVLNEIEIVAGSFPRDLFPQASALRWYQQWGAGADWLLEHPEVAKLDFTLTNASGVHAVPISEHILAYLLAFARQLPQALSAKKEKAWQHELPVFELADKTMLLVGVGAIGVRTAELAAALGMRVIGIKRDPDTNVPGLESVHAPDALPDLLPEADAVVLTLPLTEETRGTIGERELRIMKASSYLVNIGRGGLIDEPALIRALQEGWLAGAGLDVFEEEPLPQDSPLWGLENVILTAHYAGLTPRYTERALAIFLDNLKRYQAGEPLENVVDKELGY